MSSPSSGPLEPAGVFCLRFCLRSSASGPLPPVSLGPVRLPSIRRPGRTAWRGPAPTTPCWPPRGRAGPAQAGPPSLAGWRAPSTRWLPCSPRPARCWPAWASAPACAGDYALVSLADPAAAVVAEVLPRRSALVRHAAGNRTQPQTLAANMDDVFMTVAADRGPSPAKVERFLALAWESGATPVIVLTKADLLPPEAAGPVRAAAAAVAPGTEVHLVSAVTGDGIDDLSERLAAGRTAALIGSSGAGKSRLLNALAGADVAATIAGPRHRRQGQAHDGLAGAGRAGPGRRGDRHPRPARPRPVAGCGRPGRRLRRYRRAGPGLPVLRLPARHRARLRGDRRDRGRRRWRPGGWPATASSSARPPTSRARPTPGPRAPRRGPGTPRPGTAAPGPGTGCGPRDGAAGCRPRCS